MSGASTIKNNLENTAQKTIQKKHTHKYFETTTSKHEWYKHHTKQPQKHCPKSNIKRTNKSLKKKLHKQMSGASTFKNNTKMKNRIKKSHRKMSGASITKNNFKNSARHPPKKHNEKPH
jgi:hypothetical protein